ncbi:uncharacterized protein F5891DRAFT_1196677 [Suillus fuscotomentosus]|uniref:2OGFeDO JBP1/TET oxygenase domain-containing protein n=1 Tax=Suillus fuscotomentosus TaxID=1912939 RepID=A0AAD4DSP8_9AGAM|nr:uncharacterized protein F5891DRAFT_1196677 [Suillus fuscotomentosus]KAG1893225.1 hypothetical protein F5891DRAFT_1196677 [Suillus fuscotomentosus]
MDNLKSKTTELVAALTRRVGEIMGNSSELGVLQDGRVETELLHKARMRIAVQLQQCLESPADNSTFNDGSISEYEITRAALTIAHAMVNPINIDWDVDRYADKVKLSPPNLDGLPSAETDRLKKFFPEVVLGKISVPTTVIDRHGKFLVVYLPNILTPSRLEHVNHITVGLRDTLLKSLKNKNTWRDEGYMVPDGGGEFGAGRITVVPAYFMQRQERLMDPLVTSKSYRSKKVQQWMAALTTSEVLWNAITAVVAPDLFQAGISAFCEVIKEVRRPPKKPTPVEYWPSIFSGLDIIANRVTFSHRDAGGSPSLLDLLVSLGRNHHATLALEDLKAELDYSPGTMVYISGRVLEHSVGPWLNGESETEPVSPLKRKQQQRTEDYSLVEYDREVYGDFDIGGSNDIQRKTKDRYRELMRVSRIWRDLMNRIWFGHETDRSPAPGDLALYCPACPQPGINLPSSWKDSYDDWLVMQRYVVDGNFTAQHMKMKTPEDNVSLADGKGYMVTKEPYEAHITESIEKNEKSSCSNHRAVNAANVQRSNLRATGVGATACARHGCFVPHSVVDFQKGERQMNMDYSICNALKYPSENIGSALIIYDVACQWSVNFHDQGPYEELTNSLNSNDVQKWKKQAELAALDHGELLDIYQLKMDKAPTMAEIRLRLTENELSSHGRTGAISWLIEGINIENTQDTLRSSIRQQSDNPTASQRIIIEEKRQKLLSRIHKFHETAVVITNGMELEGRERLQHDDPELCLGEAKGLIFSGIDDIEEDGNLDLGDDADSHPEVAELWMPSWEASDVIMDDVIMALQQEELELRKGQANDSLEKLRQALGDRSVIFREKSHSNKSVHHQGTRSTKELRKITLAINKHAREYRRSRAAMQRLGADSDTLASYQVLKAEDLTTAQPVRPTGVWVPYMPAGPELQAATAGWPKWNMTSYE